MSAIMYATTRGGMVEWLREMMKQGMEGGTVFGPMDHRIRGRKTQLPSTGYVVGGVSESVTLEPGANMFEEFAYMLADVAVSGRPFDGIGYWLDDNGNTVLDVVRWVEHFPNAVALGIQNDEDAIYGIAEGECYSVDEWAHVPTIETYAG